MYDKEKESKGRTRSVRVEFQLRNDWATKAGCELVEASVAGKPLQPVAAA